MKILVLNCGSSSIKYKLFDMPANIVLAQGGIEKIGMKDSFLKITLPNGEKKILEREIPEHTAGIQFIFETITGKEYGCINSLNEIEAVGHRIVHGGEKFSESVLITDEVIKNIQACSDLAPLHNPANLKGVDAVKNILPNVPQIAVFDTAFHQTMPDYAYMYALPYEYYTKYGIRRYGFHGTSHRYVSAKACEFLGLDYNKTKIVTAHVGNGGSLAAICNGKVKDTSMGLTPVEGLMMGTRSGDVDLGAISFLIEKENLDSKGLSNLINKKSGLLGITGIASDIRDVDNAAKEGNDRARLALDMYHYRIKKYVGAYAAAMGGIDVLVFTGGVGENQISARKAICEGLEFMGIELDDAKNQVRGENAIISKDNSKVKIVVIPTDEELVIATDAMNIVSK